MTRLFVRALPVAVLFVTLATACGTSTPSATESTPTQAATQALSVSAPFATETPASAKMPTATAASPETISFSRDILPIFESRCMNCHGGRKTEKGLDLKTYSSLMAGSEEGSVVFPGDAENSSLAQLLLGGKMPKRGPKLTPGQVQMVVDWIMGGAQNN